ncbi:MAG: hydantoinase B/oxoprolinase family protein [Planctomycetaceae bacterium]
MNWEFWIDVGGTFTDCIARSPQGRLVTRKVLSSGVTKGRVSGVGNSRRVVDESRAGDPDGFWIGYRIEFIESGGSVIATTSVREFDGRSGTFEIDAVTADIPAGTAYELSSGEEAPILAVRTVLGLRLDEPIPPVTVKLGTTRGTNALLERKGARTAFVTTRGFADVLLIANQDRPRLFDLAIRKPSPLFERVVEIDERLDADGNVLRSPDANRVREQLVELKATGVESVAICLLHSFANAAHEHLVERLAREAGFTEISTSGRLSPLIKIVSRGDTTMMDAYLNPVLREYVGTIRQSLGAAESGKRKAESGMNVVREESAFRIPHSALKVMTSAGGLVDADRFVGKDSILSGPAGGVIGFSRVAQRAGFEKSIGFDMGGTSTDVARFDGVYEMEFETQKAGVRVVSPMLAIETVAAGGGSICGFDGVKLHVGPESAGADPGPACYGAGGPLTVTDVNLHLGKILPARFPFPLDRDAVEQRLGELCERIAASPLGTEYSPIELAQGFVQIANANMVRAIRRISVAKGYDPADYVLVTFGGAGAQHACAIAASLGIPRVLVHPFAGILSAYGIGQADVRRFGERSVLQPFDGDALRSLDADFRDLETETTAAVRAENVSDDRIDPPIRSLDLRYRGVDAVINVPRPDDGDYLRRYAELHQQLYGYVHERRPVEIVAARVEVVGRSETPEEPAAMPQARIPMPIETAQTWFDGGERETAVFVRDDLRPGDEITGPAIVCEPTSTVVIDPGWQATVLSRGELVLSACGANDVAPDASHDKVTRRRGDKVMKSQSGHPLTPSPPHLVTASPDPVLLEIFNNLFASIAEQMGVTLQRTSCSTNVKERLDFSCAIFDPAGNLVVNAPHIPVHLGAMSETVQCILADNPDMVPGDVFVTNDPYRGGSHLPDVTVITPVFDEGRESRVQSPETVANQELLPLDSQLSTLDSQPSTLLFFTASRAHHAELGGIVPGSMPPFSKNLAEEGVLIRNFRLVDAGRSREDALRELLLSGNHPTRSVEDNLADISAQVAANNNGVRQLRELVARYSLPLVQAYMSHIQRAAAEKMRLALRNIPDGEYAFTDHLDDGSQICVRVTIDGDRATVDFTGTSPPMGPPANSETPQSTICNPQSFNLNANRAIVTAAVLYVFRCLIAEDIPLNSGVLEPVEIVLPECLLNPPARDDPAQCAAVVGGNVETSQRVVDTLLGALQVAAASQGTMNNLTFGNEAFGYYETICGGSGATPDADGADAVHTHMTNTRLTDVEVIERRYPVRIRRFEIRRESGGNGDHDGGDGIVREIEFLKTLTVSMLSERRGDYPPFGLVGGAPGQLGRNTLQRTAGGQPAEPEDLGGKFAIDAQPGDVLTIETPGGGAFGGIGIVG